MSHLTPQPPPKEGTARPTWEVVIEELRAREAETLGTESHVWFLLLEDGRDRAAFGREKHGRPHQVDNGRDHAADAYQEALDGVGYWRAEALLTQNGEDAARDVFAQALYQDALNLAHRARLYLLWRDGR